MSDTSKIAKNLKAFQIAINAHDRENPTHNAYGIGLAHFDLERLGFDEGEEILPGITIHADSGVTGNFRVLCDGDHEENLEREEEDVEMVEAVLGWSRDELMAEPYLNFVHPEDLERTCQEIARATDATPCTTRYENRLRTRDGVWRWLLWSARWDGSEWSAVAKDITTRKEL